MSDLEWHYIGQSTITDQAHRVLQPDEVRKKNILNLSVDADDGGEPGVKGNSVYWGFDTAKEWPLLSSHPIDEMGDIIPRKNVDTTDDGQSRYIGVGTDYPILTSSNETYHVTVASEMIEPINPIGGVSYSGFEEGETVHFLTTAQAMADGPDGTNAMYVVNTDALEGQLQDN